MLKESVKIDLAQEMVELMEAGHDRIDSYGIIKDTIRNEYDQEIWEAVDSEENTLELDFDDFLNDLMDDIEARADYYMENIAAGN
ncbi:hypothetical protein P59_244 [Bacillus phage P59]|nr:hypothetical protein P59_015 [Bacillus phage P59]QIW88841.1 hypothetical protein P59_244 [Bacillus phage P59]